MARSRSRSRSRSHKRSHKRLTKWQKHVKEVAKKSGLSGKKLFKAASRSY